MLQHQPPLYTISQENLIFVVLLEDAPTHTIEHPFCGDDPECPCRSDSDLVREFINKPLDNGLLTNSEALRIYFGTQLTPTQDMAISDEEIAVIMAAPSPLDAQVDDLDMSKQQWLSEHL